MKNYTADDLRSFESYIKDLFKQGLVNCPVHLSGGNEDQLIDIFKGIKPHDYVLSTHRNHYHYLLKGGCPYALVEEILGQSTGVCRGHGRSMHIYDPSINFYTSAIVGGHTGIATGLALGIQRKAEAMGKKWNIPHVYCFLGDGGEDTGAFMESQRYAESQGLPVSFIIEDNDLAVETSKKCRWGNYYNRNLFDSNVLRYEYKRTYPHVGIGKHVSM